MPEDPLEVDSLPSDPREMALRLLGMTVSELKGIDEKVISGQQFVGGLKTDLNKIVAEVNTNLTPKKIESTPQPSLNGNHPQPVQEPVQPVQVSQQPIIEPVLNDYNDDQLEFDFYRKIKPEDLEYQIKKLVSSIEELTIKVDLIYNHVIKKNTRKINANISR